VLIVGHYPSRRHSPEHIKGIMLLMVLPVQLRTVISIQLSQSSFYLD